LKNEDHIKINAGNINMISKSTEAQQYFESPQITEVQKIYSLQNYQQAE
jgi:hypothetical protein